MLPRRFNKPEVKLSEVGVAPRIGSSSSMVSMSTSSSESISFSLGSMFLGVWASRTVGEASTIGEDRTTGRNADWWRVGGGGGGGGGAATAAETSASVAAFPVKGGASGPGFSWSIVRLESLDDSGKKIVRKSVF